MVKLLGGESRHTRKATPIKCFSTTGAGRPCYPNIPSETSLASFALNGRGKLGSPALARASPDPLAGLWSLGTDWGPGDAWFCVVYAGTGEAQKLQGWDPDSQGV